MDEAGSYGGGASESVSAKLQLKLPGGTLDLEVRLPTRLVELEELLPLARALEDRVVELAVHQVEATGRRVSCKAGCGACCRQLVPVSEVEARRVAAMVEGMPEPRRSAVRGRFEEARRRLDEGGLLEPLRSEDRRTMDREARGRLGRAYFALGVPCPFLEDESCSIHPERPLTCREYLVTSPAEHCAKPTPGAVEGVDLPGSVWMSFARLCDPSPEAETIHWVPLVLALEWVASHPEGPPLRPAPELFRDLIARFAGQHAPPTPPNDRDEPGPGELGVDRPRD
ncbi:YkgJ family cysteine cluster protein [Tautonia rosea]|uniref:YkgJ family cysteine cluster protein n=1 Tax=Tautonia rosea TaxID=2728037 RepID=UPI001475B424|nr:YkgJ family cysteine cluster protein [Tautonia rosea]